jgi:hypothetical protein
MKFAGTAGDGGWRAAAPATATQQLAAAQQAVVRSWARRAPSRRVVVGLAAAFGIAVAAALLPQWRARRGRRKASSTARGLHMRIG